MIAENTRMKKRASRRSARGGRALRTGLARCGRCGRMMRVNYGMRAGHAHRYYCRGDEAHAGGILCIGIGGVRVDKAVEAAILEVVSEHAVEAAFALHCKHRADDDVRRALARELEEARYDASLAARRYEVVDLTQRLVARELETRWNAALERVADLEERAALLDREAAGRPTIDQAQLMTRHEDKAAADPYSYSGSRD